MGDVTVEAVVRSALRSLAPDEEVDLDLVIEGYRRSAGGARRAGRVANQPTASAPGAPGQTRGTMLLAVGVDVAAAFGATTVAPRRWWWPWGRPSPDTPVVPLPELDIERLRELARAQCLQRGAGQARAAEVADALAGAWPRTAVPA